MTCLLVILLISLSILLIALLYVLWYADFKFALKVRKIRRNGRRIENRCKDVAEFQKQLIKASTNMINKGNKDEFPSLLDYTIQGRFRKAKKDVDPVTIFRLQYSECGWIILSILEHIIESDSHSTHTTPRAYSVYEQLFARIKGYFDSKILNAEFETVDQAQCGMIALLLYAKTQDASYKKYADEMYRWILTFDTSYGILYRPNHNRIVVDSIGMAIPFLIQYAEVFNIHEARRVALKTIEQYTKYGCDLSTGVPAYAYEVSEPHLKLGRVNWGRGISWFVIGLSYINSQELSADSQLILNKLDHTLKDVWNRDKSFGQFVGQSSHHDLSAELPILYYLTKKKLINLSKEDILDYSLMMHDGVMYNSSSSYTGIIQYGVPEGPNMLSQAYMIRLLNLCKD